MNETYVWAEAIKSIILLGMIAWVYFGPFRAARISYFRQCIFEIRNQLWDDLRECNSLNTPQHRSARDSLNGLIVSASFLDLIFFVRMAFYIKNLSNTNAGFGDKIPEIQNPTAKVAIDKAMHRMGVAVIKHTLLRTFPGCLVGIPCYAAYKCRLHHLIPKVGRCFVKIRLWLTKSADSLISVVSVPEFAPQQLATVKS